MTATTGTTKCPSWCKQADCEFGDHLGFETAWAATGGYAEIGLRLSRMDGDQPGEERVMLAISNPEIKGAVGQVFLSRGEGETLIRFLQEHLDKTGAGR